MMSRGSIGVLELSWHGYYLIPMLAISEAAFEETHVFTDESTHRELQAQLPHNDSVVYHLRSDSTPNGAYLDRVERVSSTLDFMVVVTITGVPSLARHLTTFDPGCPAACFVHDVRVHDVLGVPPAPGAVQSVLGMADRVLPARLVDEVTSRLHYLLKPYAVTNYDAWIVQHPDIKSFCEQSSAIDAPVHSFLPVVCDPPPSESRPDPTRYTVVIPGRVNPKTKDFDFLFDALDQLSDLATRRLELVFLGSPDGDSDAVLARCESYRRAGYSIRTFDRRVLEPQFDDVMRSADLLVAPLKLERQFGGRFPRFPPEIIGRTKMTGLVFDAINYGCPIVMQDQFPTTGFESCVSTVGSEADLAEVLERFVRSSVFRSEINRRMDPCCTEFTLDDQAHRFADIASAIKGTSDGESVHST